MTWTVTGISPTSRGLSGVILAVTLLIALGLTAGCRQSRQDAPPAEVRIEWVQPLFPPGAGPDQLWVRLLDRDGHSLENGFVRARGDMTHAGMVPAFGEASVAVDGVYRLPFEWSMAGDWIVTIEAELPDGRRASRQFDVTVTGDNIHCIIDD